eukprot:COSAG05_NODE_2239_length_3353_cov_423.015980_7_plen_105_part_00
MAIYILSVEYALSLANEGAPPSRPYVLRPPRVHHFPALLPANTLLHPRGPRRERLLAAAAVAAAAAAAAATAACQRRHLTKQAVPSLCSGPSQDAGQEKGQGSG